MKMTKEIAIRFCDEYLARHISDIDKEFLKIAKEALQQQPCDDCCNGNQIEKAKLCQKSYLAGMEHKQEQCADAISRQAVFEQIGGWIASGEYGFTNATDYLSKRIKAIPPVSSSENPNKCEDAISRQAVIDMTGLSEWFDSSDSYNEFVIALSELPPVTPQPKMGHWVGDGNYICSCCKRDPLDFLEPCGLDGGSYMDTPMKYCPNCGAKMQEVEE